MKQPFLEYFLFFGSISVFIQAGATSLLMGNKILGMKSSPRYMTFAIFVESLLTSGQFNDNF